MWDSIETFLESAFAGPMWPASVLLGLLICYLALAMLGAADLSFEGPDADVPDAPDLTDAAVGTPGGDVAATVATDTVGGTATAGTAQPQGGSLMGLGAVSLRWLNLGRVPVILWLGTFTIIFWCVSWILWTFVDERPSSLPVTLLLIGRNGVISIAATKFATNPMAKWLAGGSRYHAAALIGGLCEISTLEATPAFGQARFRTNGAPLLLNIRTDGGSLRKGELARITAFDPERRIYTVTKAEPEVYS